jgi:hypothetical protein
MLSCPLISRVPRHLGYQGEETLMIYEVTVQAPAINELVTTEADNEEQAKERAIYSALQRQAQAATVTVKQQR